MKDNLLKLAEPGALQFIGMQESRSKEDSNFKIVTDALRKYWYVSALVSSLIMGGVALKTFTQTRIYQSEVQISIELDKGSTGVDKLAALAGGGSNNNSDNASSTSTRTTQIETTIQLLQSKQLIKKAMDRIVDPKLRADPEKVLDNIKISSKTDIDILL
jgi:uncharacterized protein involved in exopolysaccharide biosynthesis